MSCFLHSAFFPGAPSAQTTAPRDPPHLHTPALHSGDLISAPIKPRGHPSPHPSSPGDTRLRTHRAPGTPPLPSNEPRGPPPSPHQAPGTPISASLKPPGPSSLRSQDALRALGPAPRPSLAGIPSCWGRGELEAGLRGWGGASFSGCPEAPPEPHLPRGRAGPCAERPGRGSNVRGGASLVAGLERPWLLLVCGGLVVLFYFISKLVGRLNGLK